MKIDEADHIKINENKQTGEDLPTFDNDKSLKMI
tara:strand:+ start:715 stop:816 length:102 start_codon:yes stop_codon:yes gene_type:complete